MSTSIGLQELRKVREPPLAKPLDEAVWQAWIAKGRAKERRSRAVGLKVIKWTSIVGLLATAGLWSHLTPYEVVVRFLVAASAIVVMLQSFHEPRYVVAAGLGGLALLYNPVVPVFAFSGDWQRVAVVASPIPFAASLAWRNARLAHND